MITENTALCLPLILVKKEDVSVSPLNDEGCAEECKKSMSV